MRRVDRCADSNVVDMRGENDEFILESRSDPAACNNVRRFEGLGEMTALALSETGKTSAEGLAVFAQGGDFGERVSGTGQELLR